MPSVRLNEIAQFCESFLLLFPDFAAVPRFDEREIVCCLRNPSRLITLKNQVQQVAAPDGSWRPPEAIKHSMKRLAFRSEQVPDVIKAINQDNCVWLVASSE